MKKVKLFLSLCMMCLSVAVLCMGILAANSATYNITGNMSYNMIDGVALVNTRVYKVAGTTSASDLSTACTNLSSKSFEEIERDTSTYYILSQKLDSQPLINTSSSTYSSKTTSVDIVYGAVDSGVEYYTYYVVIEIKNVSTNTDYVLTAYLSALGTSTISNIASNANGSSNAVEIESGAYSNIVIGLSYTGTTTTAETFNYTLNVSYEEMVLELVDFYLELGQVSPTDKTKLKWKLVYLDSTSWHALSDNWSTITNKQKKNYVDLTVDKLKGRGAIFVQETALGTFDYVYDGTNTLTVKDGAALWANWTSSKVCDYFAQSLIEPAIRNGGLFTVSEEEKNLISPRTLPAIDWVRYDWDDEKTTYPYTGLTSISNTSQYSDYFWLMDVGEACLYFNDPIQSDYSVEYLHKHDKMIWRPSSGNVSFWFRNPCDTEEGWKCSALLTSSGVIMQGHDEMNGIRAAFQLV